VADGRGATGELRAFRGRFYGCLGRRVDALFELTDAMLTSGTVPSPVHLSLAAVHRRGWSSLYAALWHGAIDEEALREVLAHRMSIDEDGESYGTSVYAVDQSVWPRCDAEASPGRGYYYQLVAKLGISRDSWVTPADVRRVKPEGDANEVAAEQVKDHL
jgi:hypothetical protein